MDSIAVKVIYYFLFVIAKVRFFVEKRIKNNKLFNFVNFMEIQSNGTIFAYENYHM